MTAAIEVRHLKVAYEDNIIIPDMSVQFPKGQVSIIIGANGCGKSTLLKAVGRILAPKSGEILINGRDLKNRPTREIAREVAVLPQTPRSPDGITVRELIGYGRFPHQKAIGGMSKHDLEMVDWAIAETGLEPFANRPVNNLSGGQRQRAWIAMTLAQETEIILLDEPTTYLDIAFQLDILQLLQKLNRERHYTIVMVLHELNEACRFADNIIGLKQGQLVCFGCPADVIDEAALNRIYGISATVQMSSGGYPICLEFRR